MLVSNDEQTTRKMQLDFATANGISADGLQQGVGLVHRQRETCSVPSSSPQRYQVAGVPLVVINGKYTTDVGDAGGHAAQLLALINDLAASERRR